LPTSGRCLAALWVVFCLPLAAADELFETKIRPILADNCYSCHTSSQLGGLRVDSREALLKGGKSGPAIAPGDPDKSLLITAVRQTSDKLKMPMGGKLKKEEVEALTAWVRGGAVWPEAPKVAIGACIGRVPHHERTAGVLVICAFAKGFHSGGWRYRVGKDRH